MGSNEKSPHLSSTVMSGVERLKENMSVPEGISPILKSRHKSKANTKDTKGVPYFDQVMANTKLGSENNGGKQSANEGGASESKMNNKTDKNKNGENGNNKGAKLLNKKKKKPPAGFL